MEQTIDLQSKKEFFVSSDIRFTINPTFIGTPQRLLLNSGTLPFIGVRDMFSTTPFSFSHSDNAIEFNKTTELFSNNLKNNILQQITIRPKKELAIPEEYSNFVLGVDREKINLFEDQFDDPPSTILWKNWIDVIEDAPYLKFLPQKGYPPIKSLIEPFEENLEKLSQQFKIINMLHFSKFLKEISVNPTQLTSNITKISNQAQDFLEKKGIDASGIIEAEEDYEDETLKNIRITFTIKNKNVDECIDLSRELITIIAENDKNSLENIQVQLVPE